MLCSYIGPGTHEGWSSHTSGQPSYMCPHAFCVYTGMYVHVQPEAVQRPGRGPLQLPAEPMARSLE